MANQTLKGFRDFLPPVMAVRNRVISTARSVFESYGFSELQTPTVEYADVLLGKYGPEAEKLMYIFKDNGGREVGLKYDLTVPLARVMANYPDLPKPFKRYAIQPVFRAENPQKGRYRELVQCDFDIVGSTSPAADAEILAIISDTLTRLNFTNFTIRVNSRQILFELVIKSGIPSNLTFPVLQSVDKLDKKSRAEVEEELSTKGLSPLQISRLFDYLDSAVPDASLNEIMEVAGKLGVQNIKFDPRLVRGLDYYTGIIFETVVESPKIGSITGGGRYDNLIKTLGGPELPAVGSTLGLERICDVIMENNLLPQILSTPTQIVVTVFSPDVAGVSIEASRVLRQSGINVELYPDFTAKMDKQLKYASAKSIPYAAIIGPQEAADNTVTLKDLRAGTQSTISLSEVVRVVNPT